VCGFTFTILFPKEGKMHMRWVAWTFLAGLNNHTVVLRYASTNGLPSAHPSLLWNGSPKWNLMLNLGPTAYVIQ
jgi:hypothetical protein